MRALGPKRPKRPQHPQRSRALTQHAYRARYRALAGAYR